MIVAGIGLGLGIVAFVIWTLSIRGRIERYEADSKAFWGG